MADPAGVLINIALQAAIGLALAALRPKQRYEGPRLEDKKYTSATYGETIPIGYGTIVVGGNVIWGQDIREEAVTTEIGKGNPFSVGTQTLYYYYASLAVAICHREVDELLRIYADGKLIYDKEGGIDGNQGVQRMDGLSFRFYKGTDTQSPDPLIESVEGEGNVPGYRGVAYIVIDDMPLENFGNRIPVFQFVVTFNAGDNNPVYNNLFDDNDNFGQYYDKSRGLVYGLIRIGSTKYLEVSDYRTGEILQKIWTGDQDLGFPYRPTSGPFGAQILKSDEGPYVVLTDGVAGGNGSMACVRKSDFTVQGSLVPDSNVFGPGDITYGYNGVPNQYTAMEGGAVISVYNNFTRNYFFVTGANETAFGGYDYGAVAVIGLPSCAIVSWANNAPTAKNVSAPLYALESEIDPYNLLLPGTGYGVAQFTKLKEVPGSTGMAHIAALAAGLGNIPIKVMFWRILFNGQLDYQTAILPDMVTNNNIGNNNFLAYSEPDDVLWVTGLDSTTLVQTIAAYDLNTDQYGVIAPTLRWRRNNFLSDFQMYPQSDLGLMVDSPEINANPYVRFYNMSDGSIFEEYNLNPYSYVNSSDLDWTGLSGANRAGPFIQADYERNSLFPSGQRIDFLPPAARGSENLRTVVEDICTRSKLVLADLDASELATKFVKGYAIAGQFTYRQMLDPLIAAYDFYGRENSGILEFKFNTATQDFIIAEDDLILRDADTPAYEEGFKQEADLPRSLTIRYMSEDFKDEMSSVIARRNRTPEATVAAVSDITIEFPLTLSADEAIENAYRHLLEAWVGRETFQFQLPPRYLKALTRDIAGVTFDDRTESIRLDAVTVGAQLDMEIKASVVQGAVYGYALTTQDPVTPVGYTGGSVGSGGVIGRAAQTATGYVLDMPLLRDGDGPDRSSGALMYFVAGPEPISTTQEFVGAGLQLSYAAGPYEGKASVTQGMAWGVIVGDFPDIPSPNWNGIQRETVTMRVLSGSGSFVTVTEDEMVQNDANTAILFRPATNEIEVIGFQQVADVSTFPETGRLQLSNFIRGKRGTNTMASGYSGDVTYIIFADQNVITGYLEPNARNDGDIIYRVLPVGTNIPQTVETLSQTYEHRSLMPYSVASVDINLADPSVGNWTITWIRRTRQSGDWFDFTGTVPLSEDTESYEVDILSGAGGTVLRTLTSSEPSVRYTEAQMVADFGSVPTSIFVKVYQLSAQVGRGFTVETELALE